MVDEDPASLHEVVEMGSPPILQLMLMLMRPGSLNLTSR